ncbi:DUF262 domain-containing protein [Flavobacterium sp. PL12]|uniref:DUF262 domain-containing protein n=1 Tax=Flavobacterium sp. PL12 TaxID=3071718 RepID=UPI00319E65A4
MDEPLTHQGTRHSFYELFKNENFKIEIPIIQRDYAQGRKSKLEVRDLFLQALYDYLDENRPFRNLDFVYGSTESDGHFDKFIPLDGQQRLTTLFLLHWYLANKSENIDSFKELLLEEKKSKFTYLTRSSSSEFCDALLYNGIDFNNLIVDDNSQLESITATIKDSGWYFLSWSKDPTIQSMLIMLDSIHDKFKDRPEFYDRLIDKNYPIITFLYLDLGKFKLTEDLYIKMNSRGKTLTPFENFKAKFEQHIESLYETDKAKYILKHNELEREVKIKEYFSFNIDTKWANLFWQYRELAGNKNTFDEEIMNFVCIISSNQFAIENSAFKVDYPLILKRETVEGKEVPISFYRLEKLGVLTKGLIQYLIKSLECLANGNRKINTYLENKFYFDEDEVFKNALKNSLSRVARIQFHAYLRFLILHDNDTKGLEEWMRFVHNLTENTEIDDNDKEINAFLDIEKLLPNSCRILDFQKENELLETSFFDRQVQEERIKAFLITKSDVWKKNIKYYECNNHFKGQILFLLEFSGILDYFSDNNNCDWSQKENIAYLDTFTTYAQKATAFFSIIQTPENSDFLLERAVLTKGDYLIPAANYRLNFLSSNKVSNYKRDYSWRSLLQLTNISEKDDDKIVELYWKDKRYFVKELFDDCYYNPLDITKSLKKIIKNTPTDWRKYFVENPELIRYCYQGFIKFINENNIILILKSIENSRMREMFTYNLFTKKINDEEDFAPFKNVDHQEINRECEYSFLYYNDWCYKRINYTIRVFHNTDESGEKGFFKIIFAKVKRPTEYDDFNAKIVDNLEENKFKWDVERKEFYTTRITEQATLSFIKKLCIQFNAIVND